MHDEPPAQMYRLERSRTAIATQVPCYAFGTTDNLVFLEWLCYYLGGKVDSATLSRHRWAWSIDPETDNILIATPTGVQHVRGGDWIVVEDSYLLCLDNETFTRDYRCVDLEWSGCREEAAV